MIVVHPKDPSTRMLLSIYEELPDVKFFDSYLASTYGFKHGLKGFFSGMCISEPVEALMCEVAATDREIEWCAEDFALRFGDMLREGKSIQEAAGELMDPKWIVSDLTAYNYSRLQLRESGEEPSSH